MRLIQFLKFGVLISFTISIFLACFSIVNASNYVTLEEILGRSMIERQETDEDEAAVTARQLDSYTAGDEILRPKYFAGTNLGEEGPHVSVLIRAINIILYLSGAIAVVMIVIGGIRATVAMGSEDEIGNAKKTVTYALVGLLLVIFAFVIVQNIQKFVGEGLMEAGLQRRAEQTQEIQAQIQELQDIRNSDDTINALSQETQEANARILELKDQRFEVEMEIRREYNNRINRIEASGLSEEHKEIAIGIEIQDQNSELETVSNPYNTQIVEQQDIVRYNRDRRQHIEQERQKFNNTELDTQIQDLQLQMTRISNQ